MKYIISIFFFLMIGVFIFFLFKENKHNDIPKGKYNDVKFKPVYTQTKEKNIDLKIYAKSADFNNNYNNKKDYENNSVLNSFKKSETITKNDSSQLSSFAITVNTASYSYVKNIINSNSYSNLDKSKVRIEELINYFNYDYKPPVNDLFNVETEITKSPFNDDKYFLKIGIKGKEAESNEKLPKNLVLLIDVSGSMKEEKKLPLVKKSIIQLLNNLNENDKISLITYSSEIKTLVENEFVKNKENIVNIINNLKSEDGTNGEERLRTAYKTAEKTFVKKGIIRIILFSDGEFNMGIENKEELKSFLESYRVKKAESSQIADLGGAKKAESSQIADLGGAKKIYLTTLAFSSNTYNDDLMQQAADSGNGNYYFINDYNEAIKVLSTDLNSNSEIIAKDIKIQVEFNPNNVKSYKLIGYQNRLLSAEEFENNNTNGGEMGYNHQMTAIYEVTLKDYENQKSKRYKSIPNPELINEIAMIKIYYKEVNKNVPKSVTNFVYKKDINENINTVSSDFNFALSVAYFGMILTNEIDNSLLEKIYLTAEKNKGNDIYGYKEEFIQIIKKFCNDSFPLEYKGIKRLVYTKNDENNEKIKLKQIVYNKIEENRIKIIECYKLATAANLEYLEREILNFDIDKKGNLKKIYFSDKTLTSQNNNVLFCLKSNLDDIKIPPLIKDYSIQYKF